VKPLIHLDMNASSFDPTNNLVSDVSGNGLHFQRGDNVTSTTYPTKISGQKGYSFDGGDYLKRTGETLLLKPSVSVSVLSFVKNNDNGNYTTFGICGDYTGGGGSFFGYFLSKDNTNKCYFNICKGTGVTQGVHWQKVTGTTSLYDGRYHSVIGTFDGSTISIYVDGKLENSVSFTATLGYNSTNNFAVGVWDVTSGGKQFYWNGNIFDYSIFSFAFTPLQCLDYHNKMMQSINQI